MAYDPDISDDAAEALKVRRAELEALRARLRAKAARLVEVIEDLEEPQTVSEAWRAVRLVRQADTMLIQLYADPGMVLSSATGRGMQPVRTASPTASSHYEDPNDHSPTPEQRTDKARQLIDKWIVAHARDTGFWPNGDDANAGDEATRIRLLPSVNYTLPPNVEDKDLVLHLIIGQLNASAHHQAKARGQWPDGSPFVPQIRDPGYYSVASGMGIGKNGHRTKDEGPGPHYLPWWIVRKRPP
jgi:hypothetical protein